MDIFISMPFGHEFDHVYKTISEIATEKKLSSYRVDQDRISELIAKTIERKIRGSRIVIADITGSNPNVLHEIGYAQSLGKPLILISQEQPINAPFNVRGLRIHQYAKSHLAGLRHILKQAISEATSPNELLRAMLVPSSLGHPTATSRFVVAASPLAYRRTTGRSGGYGQLKRTYSDYVGIRGILQSFGLLYGFETLPDLIDPEDYDDKVMEENMNLYCIASPKANRWTGKLLEKLNLKWVPHVQFKADTESPNLKNVRVSLCLDNALLIPPGHKLSDPLDRYKTDFGIILRAPNPFNEDFISVVIAGRSSLGTEAACRAFTDTESIETIHNNLKGFKIDLENHKQPFLALVGIERAIGDGKEEAILSTLRVDEVKKLKRQS